MRDSAIHGVANSFCFAEIHARKGNSLSDSVSLSDLSTTFNYIFNRSELGKTHRAAGVELLGGNTDFCS